MNSRIIVKCSFFAAAAMCFGNIAAETVGEDTTITLTANSGTDYVIEDGVTLTVEVANGSTYTLSGQITGTGTAKLRKTGLGTLALSNGGNDIPGGIDIAEGTTTSTTTSIRVSAGTSTWTSVPSLTSTTVSCSVRPPAR